MKNETNKLRAEIPPKAEPLYAPARYKILRGGRGSAKSWSIAIALLLLGILKPLRILCAREIQNSIEESVYRLLKDQIDRLHLGRFYTVKRDSIVGRNGTLFAFTGLSIHTVDTLKSYEGFDICWVEEGQTVQKRSWDILVPTIRKDGSEIWVSYNPDLETDETHQRFTVNPPQNTINIEMNWRDNPFFNEVMNNERLHCKEHDPDNYDNIWEGKCRPAVEGAIYYKQIAEAEAGGRVTMVPYDPMLKVQVVFDIGKGDALFVTMVQKHLSTLRYIDCITGTHFSLNTLSTDLRERKYNWGKVWFPAADGFTGDLKSNNRSPAEIFEALGWDVVPKEGITKLSVEQGILNARMMFPQCYFDKIKMAPLIESLKRYHRHVNKTTGAVTDPVHDEWSHGADNHRYVCANFDSMINEDTMPLSSGLENYYQPSDAYIGI